MSDDIDARPRHDYAPTGSGTQLQHTLRATCSVLFIGADVMGSFILGNLCADVRIVSKQTESLDDALRKA